MPPDLEVSRAVHNRNGDKEWTTESEIVEMVTDERFFFDCTSRGCVFSKWGSAIVPTESGLERLAGALEAG